MTRLSIVILGQHNLENTKIARFLGCHEETVVTWINRFGNENSINDAARSSKQTTFPEGTSQKVIAFFCQFETLPGYVRWTLSAAFKYFQENPEILGLGKGKTISRASIHRMLNAHALKPHRYSYFLQLTDPDFFTKMEHIIGVYASVKENLFCFDECTGIQALEQIAPPIPVGPKRPEYREPEYIRHGSVSVFSVLEVSSGQVFTEVIEDHTAATVIEVFKRHVKTASSTGVLNYICDNYSSHSTIEVCEAVCNLCDATLPEDLSTVEKRRAWLGSTDKRIVLHFLPFHGSWLNLIENWFGIMKKNCLDSSVCSKQEKTQNIIDFTKTWNEKYAHPFSWTYTGDDLRGKTVRKLIRWLYEEPSIMTAKFLGKQLKLMDSLIDEGWNKVSNSDWERLASAVDEKQEYFDSIIKKIDANTFKNIKAKTSEKREAKVENKIQEAKQSLLDRISNFKSKIGAALAGVLNCEKELVNQ